METDQQMMQRYRAEREADLKRRKEHLSSGEWRLSPTELSEMVTTLKRFARRLRDSHYYASWYCNSIRPEGSECSECHQATEATWTEEQRVQYAEERESEKRIDDADHGLLEALSKLEAELRKCPPCDRCEQRFREDDLSEYAGDWPWVEPIEAIDSVHEGFDEYRWCSGCLVEVRKTLIEDQREYTAEYEAQEKARAKNPENPHLLPKPPQKEGE